MRHSDPSSTVQDDKRTVAQNKESWLYLAEISFFTFLLHTNAELFAILLGLLFEGQTLYLFSEFEDYMAQEYSQREELANTITHGVGFGLAIIGTLALMLNAFPTLDLYRPFSVGVYGLSLMALYGASFLYHAVKDGKQKKFFRLLDHAAIFLLIAGSYTPFALLLLRDGPGWPIFAIIWTLAIAGIVITVFFMERMKKLCAFLYLGISWIAIFVIVPIFDALPATGFAWLVAGGVAYTLGVVFYIGKRIPYNHAIWHGFVLAGSLFHFICILVYILP